MKHTCAALVLSLLFAALAGCASPSRDQAWIELTETLADYARVLESARDEASAKAAAAKIPPLVERYKAARRQIDSLPAPTPREETTIDYRFSPALRDIKISTLQSLNRIEKDPAVNKVLAPVLRTSGAPK